MTKPTYMVTGASGQIGAQIVQLLGDCPAFTIVAGSRDPAKLDLPPGVERRAVDFDDPSSLPDAFAGIDRLLLISTNAFLVPGQRLAQQRAAVAAAAAAGVGHILYTSMPNPDGSPIPFAPDHLGTERAIAETGIPHTFLRNGWYSENLIMPLKQAVASGEWHTSAGDGRIAHISRADTARAVAAALVRSTDEVYDLTGPVARTTAEIALLAAEIFSRPIRVVQVDDETLSAKMLAAGLPDPMVRVVVGFDTNTRLGRIDIVSDAVKTLTGKPAQDLPEFLRNNRLLFA